MSATLCNRGCSLSDKVWRFAEYVCCIFFLLKFVALGIRFWSVVNGEVLLQCRPRRTDLYTTPFVRSLLPFRAAGGL